MEYHQTALKVSFITLPLLHWTDLKTTLEKSPKLWNIPAEQTSSLLPHFHSRREDLSSIVTWVLRDFGSLHTLPEKHTHSVVCTVPWFSVASLRVLISKQGANTNAPPQILLFTFGLQPHKKLSYQTCKTKIINSTKQHSFSRGQIHYKVVTFVCKFKNLHSTLTYRDPPPPLTDSEKMNWKEKCSKLNTISAHPSLENTNQPDRLHREHQKSHACSCGHCLIMCEAPFSIPRVDGRQCSAVMFISWHRRWRTLPREGIKIYDAAFWKPLSLTSPTPSLHRQTQETSNEAEGNDDETHSFDVQI